MEQIIEALQNHIDSHRTPSREMPGTKLEWPNDAEWLMQYQTKAWPCGWQEHEAFFKTEAEMRKAIAGLKYFAELEDNYYEVNAIYRWDLGPQRINVGNFV